MEIVINNCFGGFSLSHEAIMRYAKLSGFKLYPFIESRDESGKIDYENRRHEPYTGQQDAYIIHYSKEPLTKDGKYVEDSYWSDRGLARTDSVLIKVVKEMKKKANGRCADLKIVNIPDKVKWKISEYDGSEHIAEIHRTWS